MATENECKVILNLACEEKMIGLASKYYKISQGYLLSGRGISLRLRKSQSGKMNKLVFTASNKEPTFTMTFKYNNSRVIEIEKKIDGRDFGDLWTICLNKLEKYRHVVKDKANNAWEIDFFKDHHEETYFCLAELEMPEGQRKPKFLPDFIKENLVYEVPDGDCRFSSKSLGDVRYAINLRKSF